MNIKWEDSTEEDPIIHSSGRGERGMYYFGKVSTGFCISLDLNQYAGDGKTGSAFIGNSKTLDGAKAEAQRFEDSDEVLTE